MIERRGPKARPVATPYGATHGCPDCSVVVFAGGQHMCDGVTVVPPIESSFAMDIDPDAFEALAEIPVRRRR